VDAHSKLVAIAESLPEVRWMELPHQSSLEEPREPRQRPENVKNRIVKERGYKSIRTDSEQEAEFTYHPGKCKNPYRGVALRRNLSVEKEEQVLFDEIRYSFFIINERFWPLQQIVYLVHARCDYENDIE